MFERGFTAVTSKTADRAGRPGTFVSVCLLVVLWAATGPHFHYSDTWQLVINTSTTIITCLLAFLIQSSQNRSELALQIKLDELILSDISAHKVIIGIEKMALSELELIRDEIERTVAERAE